MALLTKRQIAQHFQVSTRTIDRWRAMGIDLGVIKTPGGAVRFNPVKLESTIRAGKFKRLEK
jgi:transposase